MNKSEFREAARIGIVLGAINLTLLALLFFVLGEVRGCARAHESRIFALEVPLRHWASVARMLRGRRRSDKPERADVAPMTDDERKRHADILRKQLETDARITARQ